MGRRDSADTDSAKGSVAVSIDRVEVRAICDGCGKWFCVEMELSDSIPQDWTLYDAAVNAVRGSLEYRDAKLIIGSSSVQDGKHLCDACTDEAYAKTEGGA